MTNSYWNELTLTYDEKFKTLEQGRLAYVQAMTDTLSAIQHKLEIGGIDGVMRVESSPADLLRKLLRYTPNVGEDQVQVLVRFSAPWEGPSGLLQFVLEAEVDQKWIESLRKIVRSDEFGNRQPQINLMENPKWIGSGAVSLSDPELISSASEALRSWARLGVEALKRLREQDLGYRIECLLKAASKIYDGLYVRFGAGDCGKLEYVQSYNGVSNFWVGWEPESRSLMCGNIRPAENPEEFQLQLQEALQEKLGAGKWGVYGGFPAGTIMSEETLRSASDGEICRAVVEGFKIFADVISETESMGQSRGSA